MADIRRATPADIEALLAMAAAMHAESPRYRSMQFNPEKLRNLAQAITSAPHEEATILVAAAGGEILGMFVGLIAQRWFGDDRFATDLAVYVKPEHRRGGLFFRLVRAAEEWATGHGIEDLDIGVSTDVHTEETVHAYLRMGYTLSPTRVVTKKLQHGH